MEIVFIKETENESEDVITKTKQSLIGRIQQAVNVLKKDKVKTLILPIVPNGIKLPSSVNIESYEAIEKPYSLPDYKKLEKITWSSFLPHQKSYGFIHKGSSINAYEYVEFLTERQKNKLPFRLLVYDYPKNLISVAEDIFNKRLKILYDGFVLVENFEYSVDTVGDLKYTIGLNEFNAEIVTPQSYKDDVKSIMTSGIVNEISRYALQLAGLV